MDRLTQMTVFATVVDNASFTGAAQQLGIAKSTVSRHVASLEERLGVRLLNRTTRSLRPTDVGRAYYERCARIVADAQEADRAVTDRGDAPRGTLRLTAPKLLANRYFTEPIRAYMDAWPEVSVELHLDDRKVDIIEDGLDLAIRVARPEDTSLVAKKLGKSWHIVVCSPSYIEKHGEPAHPRDLADHNLLTRIGGTEGLALDGPDGTFRFPKEGRYRSNDAMAMLQGLEAGLGIGFVPDFMVRDGLRDGTLKRILREWTDEPRPVYALYPHRRLLSQKVRVFLDMLVEHLGSPAPWECPSGFCGEK